MCRRLTDCGIARGVRAGVHLVLLSVAIFAFTVFGSAQGSRVVRWQESAPAAKRLSHDGIVAKQLIVDEMSFTAAVTDRGDSFCLQVEIHNAGQRTIDVRSGSIQLQAIRPRFRMLGFIPAPTLAASVRRSAGSRAAGIEGQGSVATTTVHEQLPVTVTSFNPASILDPTQPTTITTMGTETVVRTVPDQIARAQSQNEGIAIRNRAEADARQIVESALTDARLGQGSQVAGRLYFERDDQVTETVVRLQVDGVTVDIPFTARKKTSLLRRGAVIFD